MSSSSIGRIVLVATLLAGAGCLGTGPQTTPTETPVTGTPGSETPPTDSPTPTPPSLEPHSPSDGSGGTPSVSAVDHPDPDKAVILTNLWDQPVEIHVTVYRNATGETVYDETHELEAGAEREVYNTQQANPEGVERFAIRFSALNTTEQFSIETSACYGNAYGEVQDDGTFYPYYAIC
jgi:hypothetical protein